MSHGRRLSYQPALDGIRALAVIAVVLFHGGVAGFDGGYIGVSVFFTLSGYLITALLLAEHEDTGSISFSTFYSRRVRRLLPASLVCVAMVVLVSATTDWFDGVADLFAQVLGALLQVENWVLIAGSDTYQNLLARGAGRASPLTHFWSLAIEEQFYWVWPLVMAGALKLQSGLRSSPTNRRPLLAMIGTLALLFSLAAPLIASVWGPDAAYWATPARVAEILIGGVAAVVFTNRSIPKVAAPLGWIGLGAVIACVVLFPTSGGPAYAGALPLVAIASTAMVIGAQADGSLQTVLSVSPLVAIGKVSYGAYLYHWPIFVILDSERIGIDGIGLLLLRLQTTAVVTLASYYLLEQPIRVPGRPNTSRTVGAGLVATGLVVVAAATVVPVPVAYWQADTAQADAVSIDTAFDEVTAQTTERSSPTSPPPTSPPPPTTTTAPPAGANTTAAPAAEASTSSTSTSTTTSSTSTTIPDLGRPMRVVAAGDSTSGALANGLIEWAIDNDDAMQVEDLHFGGCGVLTGGERYIHKWEDVPEGCDHLIQVEVPAEVEALRPDVVLISVNVWDLVDRRWDGEIYTPLDQTYQDHLLFDYTAAVQRMLDAGAGSVLLVINPPTHTNWKDEEASDDPARQEVLAAITREIADSYPGQVYVADLWAFVDERDLGDDRRARPDGVHWSTSMSTTIAREFLVAELFRAAGVRPPPGALVGT